MGKAKLEDFINAIFIKLGVDRNVYIEAEIEDRIKNVPNNLKFKLLKDLSDPEYKFMKPMMILAKVSDKYSNHGQGIEAREIENRARAKDIVDKLWSIHKDVNNQADKIGKSSEYLFGIVDVKSSGLFTDEEYMAICSARPYHNAKELVEKINLFSSAKDVENAINSSLNNPSTTIDSKRNAVVSQERVMNKIQVKRN